MTCITTREQSSFVTWYTGDIKAYRVMAKHKGSCSFTEETVLIPKSLQRD